MTDLGYDPGQLASSIEVLLEGGGGGAGVSSFNTRDGAVTLLSADVLTALGYTPGYINLPRNAKTGAYTLLASDVSKSVPNTTGGWTVDNSVFAAGDIVVLYNNSASDQTITQGAGVTLRLGGTATTGDRTVAQRGLATLFFNSASECIVGGTGVT